MSGIEWVSLSSESRTTGSPGGEGVSFMVSVLLRYRSWSAILPARVVRAALHRSSWLLPRLPFGQARALQNSLLLLLFASARSGSTTAGQQQHRQAYTPQRCSTSSLVRPSGPGQSQSWHSAQSPSLQSARRTTHQSPSSRERARRSVQSEMMDVCVCPMLIVLLCSFLRRPCSSPSRPRLSRPAPSSFCRLQPRLWLKRIYRIRNNGTIPVSTLQMSGYAYCACLIQAGQVSTDLEQATGLER